MEIRFRSWSIFMPTPKNQNRIRKEPRMTSCPKGAKKYPPITENALQIPDTKPIIEIIFPNSLSLIIIRLTRMAATAGINIV